MRHYMRGSCSPGELAPPFVVNIPYAAGQALDVATALAVAGAMVIRPFTTSQNVLRDPDVRRILSKLDLVQEIATSPQPLPDIRRHSSRTYTQLCARLPALGDIPGRNLV